MVVWSVPNLGPKCWKLRTVLGSPETDLWTIIGPYALFVCKLWFLVLLGWKWPWIFVPKKWNRG